MWAIVRELQSSSLWLQLPCGLYGYISSLNVRVSDCPSQSTWEGTLQKLLENQTSHSLNTDRVSYGHSLLGILQRPHRRTASRLYYPRFVGNIWYYCSLGTNCIDCRPYVTGPQMWRMPLSSLSSSKWIPASLRLYDLVIGL